MECQTSDSKKLFKVFDASKHRKARKKNYDEENSVATDDTFDKRVEDSTAKASLQDLSTIHGDVAIEAGTSKRERLSRHDSSPSESPTTEIRQTTRSPHHHRKHVREGRSLALKPANISTPRSLSPHLRKNIDPDCTNETPQDSVIYAFLEDAIKKDKRRHRHSHRHGERRLSRDRRRDHRSHDASRDGSPRREHRHRHHRRHSHDRDKQSKANSPVPVFDQNVFLQTFAQICAQMTEKNALTKQKSVKDLPRTLSHKSLQCEVLRNESCDVDQRPVRLSTREPSWENIASRVRSHENLYDSKVHLQPSPPVPTDVRREREKYYIPYERDPTKYSSRVDVDRYRQYPPPATPARSCIDQHVRPRPPPPERRDYRDFDDQRRPYDARRYFEQKTSRSFDVPREGLAEYEKCCRRTSRSDSHNKRRYEDGREKRYDDRKDPYYEEKEARPLLCNLPSKDRRSKRNLERLERSSVVSRDEDFRERFSERERDSGLSIADGASTVSGKSNYLRAVKQEIADQRDTMDKMMKLWKDMMRYFKNMPETSESGQQKKNVQDGAASMQETATAQLRLWRECMRRYETVARDVGDTDARLMEEINKQRSEMAEMAGMWQECLQRYRDMSNDFNSLKKQLTPEPVRPVPPPLVCAEGEGPGPAPPYRVPPGFPPMMNQPSMYESGSPLRSRASAPPLPGQAWWWGREAHDTRSPRRRSSPDSRGSRDRDRDRDRDRKHRHKERDEPRYKEKSSKPSAARSEHRHRKR